MTAFAKTAKNQRPRGVVALDGKALRRGYERGKSHMPPIIGDGVGRTDPSGFGQCNRTWQQRSSRCPAAHRADPTQGLRGDGRCLALPSGHGQSDRGAGRGLCPRSRTISRPCWPMPRPRSRQPSARKPTGRHRGRLRWSTPKARRRGRAGQGDGPEERLPRTKGSRPHHQQARQGQDRRALLPDEPMLQPQRGVAHRAPALGHRKLPASTWPLDVVLDEDLARNRKDNAPANLAVLKRLALNIVRAHPDTTTSLRGKLKRAGWDDAFLFTMLGHMR